MQFQLVSPLQTTSIGNSVIQEQTAVQSDSPSNVSWLSQNSDSYTSRQADGTHFNETSLTQMANETYSNMTTILSKTAILPIVLPRLNLVKNGTYDYTASTSTTYSIYRWKNGYGGHPFEQDEANMGNNYNPNPGSSGDPGFSGFVKSSDGKISQIVPWVYINSVPGARLGVESTVDELTLESTKVFPNPLSKDNKLNVSFSTTMETPMKIRILDQNGLILKEMSDVLSIGKHNYSIALDDLHLNSEINFIYYKLETKQHNEIKRVLLTK